MNADSHSWIALHTSNAAGALAVGNEHTALAVALGDGTQHASAVLGRLSAALAQLGRVLEDVQGVVVTRGPGSFTGIRVGLATAQGLAAARGWSVWTCGSLFAEASVHQGCAALAVVLDARRGEVFAAAFDTRGEVPVELVAPFCAAPEAAAPRLEALTQLGSRHAVQLVGSGVNLVAARLRAAGVLVEERAAAPPPAVAQQMLVLVARGACSVHAAHELRPLYLRASDAEILRAPRRDPS